MASLLRHSFQSRQSKDFVELALRALPCLRGDANSAKKVYKSIKHNKNTEWQNISDATRCLQDLLHLNLEIASYERVIRENTKNKLRAVLSAKSHLTTLSAAPETSQLCRAVERGFNLQPNSLTPKLTFTAPPARKSRSKTPAPPSDSEPRMPKQRSRSVCHRREPPRQSDRPSFSPHSANSSPNRRGRSTSSTLSTARPLLKLSPSNPLSTLTLYEDEGHDADDDVDAIPRLISKQRSNSVHTASRAGSAGGLQLTLHSQSTHSAVTVPPVNSAAYLHFLGERALSSKAWNDNDADRLCQAAIAQRAPWLTVHSMWTPLCRQLLDKYANRARDKKSRSKRKARRRGSKIVTLKETKSGNDDDAATTTRVCATIGYPLGQSSRASKVAEAAQAVIDGAARIRLYIAAGKVVTQQWAYIIREVKEVIDAAKGCDVRLVIAETPQMTQSLRDEFNEQMRANIKGLSAEEGKSEEGAQREHTQSRSRSSRSRRNSRKALRCTFSDESSSDEAEVAAESENERASSSRSRAAKDAKDPKRVAFMGSPSYSHSRHSRTRSRSLQLTSSALRGADLKLNRRAQSISRRDDIYSDSDDDDEAPSPTVPEQSRPATAKSKSASFCEAAEAADKERPRPRALIAIPPGSPSVSNSPSAALSVSGHSMLFRSDEITPMTPLESARSKSVASNGTVNSTHEKRRSIDIGQSTTATSAQTVEAEPGAEVTKTKRTAADSWRWR